MSITTVNHTGCSSYGLLVRAYVAMGRPELSRFVAFQKHGGKRKAKALAQQIEAELKAEAQRMRNAR
jgi:hypothetical protein